MNHVFNVLTVRGLLLKPLYKKIPVINEFRLYRTISSIYASQTNVTYEVFRHA